MPVQQNRHRQNHAAFNTTPKFHLGDSVPQRTLQPMAAVSTDPNNGTMSYAPVVPFMRCSGAPNANFSATAGGTGASGFSSTSKVVASHSASKVLPLLYLGSQGDALNQALLKKHHIRHILNAASECIPTNTLAANNNANQQQYAQSPPPIQGEEGGATTVTPVIQVQTKHLDLKDHSDENIARHFTEALHFIHQAIAIKKEAVLVHCRFGVSRSATIVMAYLMTYGGSRSNTQMKTMTYDCAFDFVKACRPQVSPNLGFVLALHNWEFEQQHEKSVETKMEGENPRCGTPLLAL